MARLSVTSVYFPERGQGAVEPTDLLFECKENYRNDFVYRKLIPDQKAKYHHEKGTSFCVKPTGKWWHEDDFATKWINPQKTRLWIVKHYDGIIRELEALYIPGEGWKEGSSLSAFLKEAQERMTSSVEVIDTETSQIA
ncbi:MAG: hypothetical protein IE916_00510 [Epsilonproteobacteria bacterium]|nr:hypothetical protein [Campylobacterota bacterium]